MEANCVRSGHIEVERLHHLTHIALQLFPIRSICEDGLAAAHRHQSPTFIHLHVEDQFFHTESLLPCILTEKGGAHSTGLSE